MDKLKTIIKDNRRSIIFLFILIAIALISGSIFSLMLNDNDKKIVSDSINNFFGSINSLNYIDTLKSATIEEGLFIFIIWLLGFSIIGIPIILFSFFLKIFSLGFSICNIIIIYKTKGILLALFYIFPHHIISIINYGLLTIVSLKVSISLLYAIFKRKKIDFKPIMNKYLIILGISVVLSIISILLEIYLMPILIGIVI